MAIRTDFAPGEVLAAAFFTLDTSLLDGVDTLGA